MLDMRDSFEYAFNDVYGIARFDSIDDVYKFGKASCEKLNRIEIKNFSKTCLFLDDERVIEDVKWVEYPKYWRVITVRTFEDFKKEIVRYSKCTTMDNVLGFLDFSFDHDIMCYDEDGKEYTGYDCVKWLCDFLVNDHADLNKLNYVVHSKNPVGAENITTYIENYKGFLNERRE